MSLQPSTAQRAITPAASPHSTSILEQQGSKRDRRNKTRLPLPSAEGKEVRPTDHVSWTCLITGRRGKSKCELSGGGGQK